MPGGGGQDVSESSTAFHWWSEGVELKERSAVSRAHPGAGILPQLHGARSLPLAGSARSQMGS